MDPPNLFDPIPKQDSIEQSFLHRVRPLNALVSGAPITFQDESDQTHALDLSRSKLYVKLKVVKANGTAVAALERTGLINYPIGTLWARAEGYLNDTKISDATNYGLKAYVEALLATSTRCKDEQLASAGYYKDDAVEFDSTTVAPPNYNWGFYYRNKLTAESKICELIGPMHLAMFHTGRLIPPGVSLRVTLYPTNNKVALMANAGSPKVVIEDAALHLHKVQLTPDSELRLMKGLDQQNAIYRLPKSLIRTHPLAAQTTAFEIPNFIVSDRLPDTVVIGFTRTAALQGDYKKNVLRFDKSSLDKLVLHVNGQRLAAGGDNNIDLWNYLSLYEDSMPQFLTQDGIGISRLDHPDGYYLIKFQISPSGDEYVSKIKGGTIDLEGNFGTAIADGLTMIAYCQYNSSMEINKKREVLIN